MNFQFYHTKVQKKNDTTKVFAKSSFVFWKYLVSLQAD